MRSLSIFGSVLAVVAAVVGLTVIFGSWFTIDQGERGVVLTNGAYSYTAEPGLGFKWPIVQGVSHISVQSHKRAYGGDESGAMPGLASYSRDQQPADIRLSVNFRADPSKVAVLYERYGSIENAVSRLVDPKVYEEVKNVFGQYNAVTAVQERARLNADIELAVREGVGTETPIIIETVQIENIDFSDAYERSIEERMMAEVEVARRQQNLAKERIDAEIAVTQAQGRADSVLAEAKARADATRLQGEAEAEAIRARGSALAANPGLVALVQAETWDGKLPMSMIPSGAVPFLNVSPAP